MAKQSSKLNPQLAHRTTALFYKTPLTCNSLTPSALITSLYLLNIRHSIQVTFARPSVALPASVVPCKLPGAPSTSALFLRSNNNCSNSSSSFNNSKICKINSNLPYRTSSSKAVITSFLDLILLIKKLFCSCLNSLVSAWQVSPPK